MLGLRTRSIVKSMVECSRLIPPKSLPGPKREGYHRLARVYACLNSEKVAYDIRCTACASSMIILAGIKTKAEYESLISSTFK